MAWPNWARSLGSIVVHPIHSAVRTTQLLDELQMPTTFELDPPEIVAPGVAVVLSLMTASNPSIPLAHAGSIEYVPGPSIVFIVPTPVGAGVIGNRPVRVAACESSIVCAELLMLTT